MTQEDIDTRAGHEKPWWGEAIEMLLRNPEMNAAEIARVLKLHRGTVLVAIKSTNFQKRLKDSASLLDKNAHALEVIPNLDLGIRFSYTRSQIINKAREVIMDALNDNSQREIRNKSGELVGYEPAISVAEKAKIGVEAIKALSPPKSNTTIIGRQQNAVNINNSTGPMEHDLPPALAEMMTALRNSVPMKRIDRDDGSHEFVIDLKQAKPETVEVTP